MFYLKDNWVCELWLVPKQTSIGTALADTEMCVCKIQSNVCMFKLYLELETNLSKENNYNCYYNQLLWNSLSTVLQVGKSTGNTLYQTTVHISSINIQSSVIAIHKY